MKDQQEEEEDQRRRLAGGDVTQIIGAAPAVRQTILNQNIVGVSIRNCEIFFELTKTVFSLRSIE